MRAYLDAFGLVFGAFAFGLDPHGLWHWTQELFHGGASGLPRAAVVLVAGEGRPPEP